MIHNHEVPSSILGPATRSVKRRWQFCCRLFFVAPTPRSKHGWNIRYIMLPSFLWRHLQDLLATKGRARCYPSRLWLFNLMAWSCLFPFRSGWRVRLIRIHLCAFSDRIWVLKTLTFRPLFNLKIFGFKAECFTIRAQKSRNWKIKVLHVVVGFM